MTAVDQFVDRRPDEDFGRCANIGRETVPTMIAMLPDAGDGADQELHQHGSAEQASCGRRSLKRFGSLLDSGGHGAIDHDEEIGIGSDRTAAPHQARQLGPLLAVGDRHAAMPRDMVGQKLRQRDALARAGTWASRHVT